MNGMSADAMLLEILVRESAHELASLLSAFEQATPSYQATKTERERYQPLPGMYEILKGATVR